MRRLSFEYRITILYLLIGGLWILFSDKILLSLISDSYLLTSIQIYKGWFFVTVTSILLFVFLKKHLRKLSIIQQELKKHKGNLEILVNEKTKKLQETNETLKTAHAELLQKNNLINEKNHELEETLRVLNETQAQLIHSEKMASLGTLTAGVAHEINNPLNYIMGAYVALTKYFSLHPGKDEDKISKTLNIISIGINKASDIVKSLSLFSRQNLKLDEKCDIHFILDNCLKMINYYVKDRIEIKKVYCSDTIIVNGNIGKLHQVFINILTNSYQAIIEAGFIKIITVKKDYNVEIIIEDNGIGISELNLSKITEPFFTTKEPGQGTGLGLSLAYSIIKEHQGDIIFKSKIDYGTTVIISLPYST